MKFIVRLICVVLLTTDLHAQLSSGTEEEMKSLGKHITALNEAFAKGDAAAVARLHHPNIVKYFDSRDSGQLRRQLLLYPSRTSIM